MHLAEALPFAMPLSRAIDGHVDLNLVATLIVLVEERSTVAAARRLHLAQSTVSGALAKLRDTFDDPLLVRDGRALEPTPRALELVEAARPHLAGLVAAVGATTDFDPRTDRRTFRLGCTDAVALTTLAALSGALRTDAPGCDLVVRVGDYRTLPGMLASGEVSSALGYLREDPPATAKVRVLRRSPWVVLRDVSRPPVSGLDDFCSRPHALVTPLGDLGGFVDDRLRELDRERRVAIGVSSFALLLAALPGSDLLASVPDFVADELARLAPLAIDPSPVALPPVTNTLAWRAVADRDPAERWLRSRLAATFAPADPTVEPAGT